MSELGPIFRPFIILIGVVIIVRFIFERFLPDLLKDIRLHNKIAGGRKWRTDRDLLCWLKRLKPWEFEKYIADLFTKLGYKSYVVGGGYDRGVDIVAEKDGLKHYIQCKKYITSVVGVNELRDFYGAIADHLAQAKGYFITTNKFTLEAERFAADKPIELIDGNQLIKYIRLTEKSN